MRGRFLRIIVLGVSLFIAGIPSHARGESSDAPPEYLLKAVFLYNFAKFVEWPAASFKNPHEVTLCILGTDPFGDALASIEGKTAMGRKLAVKRIQRIEDARGSQILFISHSEENRLPAILMKARKMHILSVADMEGFAQKGGIITLVTVKNRIRLEINIDASRRAGLKISSKLLGLSKVVRDRDGESGQ